MKLWKKIALVLFLLLVASQIPFCYRRYQLSVVSSRINELSPDRVENNLEGFKHYVGVIHVHTHLGGHSVGTFDELILAAKNNQLDFVLLTEHPHPLYDTAKQTLNGTFQGVLFVGGNEISSKQGDRFLIFPSDPNASQDTTQDTASLLNNEKAAGRLVLITYPDKYKAWDLATNFDGTEVYSLHTDAKKFPKLATFFDYFWSFGAYPELTIARNFARPNENLKKFDELTASGKKLTLFGASDAHSNIGLSFSDRANHDLFKIQIDPYEQIFRLVRLHIWLRNDEELNTENLLAAIKNNHCYIGFDVFGSSNNFIFVVENELEKKIMGSEIAMQKNLKLVAKAPLKCRFLLFKNGEKISEINDVSEMSFGVTETGVYRVEAYLDDLKFSAAPWIISNPIYVR